MSFESLALIVFWISVGAISYTYVGYPLLLAALSWLRPRSVNKSEVLPHVTLIITAYNEERDLAAKLENTLAIDYPKDRLEILVASDCSTDRTDDIVRGFAERGVRLHRQQTRLGKTAAQNAAVAVAAGEIILFSDATTAYSPDVLRQMVPNFADSSVGCVAGRLEYIDPSKSSTGRGAVSYWNYELLLRRYESRVCSLIGASGCLYAVRKSAYKTLREEACSDFLIATIMVEQGLRAVFEPDALCTEETNYRSNKEMRMRIRVIAQTFNDLWRHRAMMNPFRSGFYAVELMSHKVFRYLVPLFLFAILISSILLMNQSWFFTLIVAGQVCFYGMAALGFLLEQAGLHSRILALPQYFILGNIAIVAAFSDFIRGQQYARWDPIREARSADIPAPGESKS
jgi:cellulose synthase/poly-beta-1,6-N-acetylglucosamine synthase-like glycosyltransferase